MNPFDIQKNAKRQMKNALNVLRMVAFQETASRLLALKVVLNVMETLNLWIRNPSVIYSKQRSVAIMITKKKIESTYGEQRKSFAAVNWRTF